MTFDTDVVIPDGDLGHHHGTAGIQSKSAYGMKGLRDDGEEKSFQIPLSDSEDLQRFDNFESLEDLLNFGYESPCDHDTIPTLSPLDARTPSEMPHEDSGGMCAAQANGGAASRASSGNFTLRKTLHLVDPTEGLSLTKPLYSEGQNLCIFGSNVKKWHPKEALDKSSSHIRVVRCKLLDPVASKSWSLVDELELSAPILDLEWLVPDKSILHCGDHGYYVLNIETMQDLKLTSKTHSLTQVNLRQTTLNKSKTKFASGGHEKRLTIYSLDVANGDASPLLTETTDGTISSISWHPLEPDICSWTTENHSFQIYDCRTGKPAQKLDGKRLQESTCLDPSLQCLYTHGYMTSFQVKLGMQTVTHRSGHGSYLALDLRMFKSASMWYWKDPTLYAVGDIVSSPYGDMNACFGRGGFSAWQNRNLTPTGYLGSFQAKQELSTSGTFLDESNIAVTDDAGCLKVFKIR